MRWKRARKSAAAAEKATQAVWRARGGSGLRGGPGSEDEDEALAEVNFGGGPRVLKEREWRSMLALCRDRIINFILLSYDSNPPLHMASKCPGNKIRKNPT